MKKLFLTGMLLIALLAHSRDVENKAVRKIDISLSEDKSSFIIFVANTSKKNRWICTHTLWKDFIFQLSDNKTDWSSLEKAKKLKASISGIIIFTAPEDVAVISIPMYKIQDFLSMKFTNNKEYSLSVFFKPVSQKSRTIKFSLSQKDIEAIRSLEAKRQWWKIDTIKINQKMNYPGAEPTRYWKRF